MKHGHSKPPTRVYIAWRGMIRRCREVQNKRYARYGGRGIGVCLRWMEFENFLSDMGEPPDGMSLDRINNDGDYEPLNCRWATNKQQAANRNSRGGKPKLTPEIVAEIRGSNIPHSVLAERFGVCRSTIRRAINGRFWRYVV